ncbi:MAG: hypothetical protein IIT35_03195, partial [Oscillospiraceae bacterium]|nr:hypothetical protein [Oscillospiraceae bacterium]
SIGQRAECVGVELLEHFDDAQRFLSGLHGLPPETNYRHCTTDFDEIQQKYFMISEAQTCRACGVGPGGNWYSLPEISNPTPHASAAFSAVS